jgi:helicase
MDKKEIIKTILEINNYEQLNPVQEKATEHLNKYKSLVVCSPTASGKTTIFEMFLLDFLLNKKKKVIYLSPLKALTFEHFLETRRKFSKKYDIRVGVSTGDLDSSSKNLKQYDVLFLTYEKFDSIVRHNPEWLKDIGLLTIDEVHELGSDRGATLETLITQIKHSFEDVCFLGLSATVKNSKDIADWLNAELIESNYRPVPLEIGVLHNKTIYFSEDQKIIDENTNINDNGIIDIIVNTLKQDKQIIVFCNSRKNTMSFSKKYSKIISKYVDAEKLKEVAKEVAEVLEQPTQQCLDLYNVLCNGVCFHHAGLVYKQRQIIEDNFKSKKIKVIFATPTLAAGINLPAFRVILHSIYRFSSGSMVPIPTNEFFQMSGRAGRPKYDTKGEAIINVSKENDIQKIYQSYILAGPSNIESQLAKSSLLRTSLLSIIMMNNFNSISEVFDYFTKTFYYKMFGNNKEFKEIIQELVDLFVVYGFLEGDSSSFNITDVGRKVCLLYIDPISANNVLNDIVLKKDNDLKTIFTIVNTSELFPYINYKQPDEDILFKIFEDIQTGIYFDYEDINLLKKIQLSRLINDWISEENEDHIIKKYNSSPGHIQEITTRSKWICHCILELSRFIKIDLLTYKKYKDLSIRIQYGIKQELVSLVQLKNIGRVRARLLFKNNIKTIDDVKKQSEKFISIVGKHGLLALKQLNIDAPNNSQQKTIN